MGLMFKAMFSALAMFFSSFEGFAGALSNLSKWADESTASFVDEARISRYSNRVALLNDLGITQEEFDAKVTAAAEVVKPKTKALPRPTAA